MLNKNTTHFHTPLHKTCQLRIIPFTKCNFSCSYCEFWKYKSKEMNFELLSYFLDKKFIPEMSKIEFTELEISLQGGELTIKNLDWFDDFIKILKKLNKLNKKTHIVFFTNFYKKNEYYDELAKKFLKHFDSLDFIVSWHEEFWELDKFLNKINNFTKFTNDKLNIVSTFFRKIEDNELFLKLFNNGNIQYQSINDQDYYDKFNEYKNYIRPVKCYAYDYIIDPDMTIKHYCNKQKFSVFKFKPKEFYMCNDACTCASQEYMFKKELIKVPKESNEYFR